MDHRKILWKVITSITVTLKTWGMNDSEGNPAKNDSSVETSFTGNVMDDIRLRRLAKNIKIN